jgi:hypothetical protein
MININNMGKFVHWSFFWYMPYRSGNLARSIGDLGKMPAGIFGEGIGFEMFNKNQAAPYGAILNEAPVIRYSITNVKTGKTYKGEYVNRHYKWVDNAMENIANDFAAAFNLRRVL